MSDQPKRLLPKPAILTFLQQGYDAARDLLVERDDLKRNLELTKGNLEIETRRADLAEQENQQLRLALDHMTAERDGYFQDATILRSQLMGAGNSILEAVNSTTKRQAFTSPAHTKESIEDRPLPHFLADVQNEPPRRAIDLERLAVSINPQ